MPGPVDWRQRLWYYVIPNEATGCWEWSGSKNRNGYGQVRRWSKIEKAHRLAFEIANGDVPCGMLVCHHCDNPSCVNPSHLYAGTPLDNVVDRRVRGRFVCNKQKKIGETGKCLSGRHDWTLDNIRRTKQGRNLCLACNRETKKRNNPRGMWRSPVLDG